MPTVTCRCKEVYHAGDEHIGKEIQCRKCGRKVKIKAEKAKRPKREPRARKPRPERAARATRSAPRAADANGPHAGENQRLDPKTRKRLLIAGAAFAALALILAAQVMSSLRSSPTQMVPVSVPDDAPG